MEVFDNSSTALTARPNSSVMYFTKHPHVHVHSIVTDYGVMLGDDGVLELCCHCCGNSMFVLFNLLTTVCNPAGHKSLITVKEEFVELHKECANIQVPFGQTVLYSNDFKLICHGARNKTTTHSVRG
jgi:hypothetical protein